MKLAFNESLQLEINNMLENYKKGEYEVARDSALLITKKSPNYTLGWKILGDAFLKVGQVKEALGAIKKLETLDPKDPECLNILGVIFRKLGRLEDAEESHKKAIKFKPDFAEAYSNLGNIYVEIGKLEEAEVNYKKAITFKTDYTKAYYNLGVTLQDLGKLEEAEKSYKKTIKLKPDHAGAHNNLNLILRQNQLLLNISKAKKINEKNQLNSFEKVSSKSSKIYQSINNQSSDNKLISNPFLSNRKVESELITRLYEMNSVEIVNKNNHYNDKDARYGNGRCSDFRLLENDSFIIKTLTKDLVKIMSEAVKSEIYIIDSFFNIYKDGSGSVPHAHIDHFDDVHGLNNKKYSLTYYLSVGDQDCIDPGILKLYDPNVDILPSKGTIVIVPASRSHSAVYGGKADRVMIGINFYSLL